MTDYHYASADPSVGGPPMSPPPFVLDLAAAVRAMKPDDGRLAGIARTMDDIDDAMAERLRDRAGRLASGLILPFLRSEGALWLAAWKEQWATWKATTGDDLRPACFDDAPAPTCVWPVRIGVRERYTRDVVLVLDALDAPAHYHPASEDVGSVPDALKAAAAAGGASSGAASELPSMDGPFTVATAAVRWKLGATTLRRLVKIHPPAICAGDKNKHPRWATATVFEAWHRAAKAKQRAIKRGEDPTQAAMPTKPRKGAASDEPPPFIPYAARRELRKAKPTRGKR